MLTLEQVGQLIRDGEQCSERPFRVRIPQIEPDDEGRCAALDAHVEEIAITRDENEVVRARIFPNCRIVGGSEGEEPHVSRAGKMRLDPRQQLVREILIEQQFQILTEIVRFSRSAA